MKASRTMKERALLDRELLQVSAGTSILPEDARHYARPIQALPEKEQSFLLPRALQVALHRFGTTRSVQDVSATVRAVCESESDRLESELTIVRYIAWAIPSIGFLGTVRGIGTALGQAQQAVNGTSWGHHEPGCGVQLDICGAGDQHHADVFAAPVVIDSGSPGAGQRELL